jgi:hypothetical protein
MVRVDYSEVVCDRRPMRNRSSHFSGKMSRNGGTDRRVSDQYDILGGCFGVLEFGGQDSHTGCLYAVR